MPRTYELGFIVEPRQSDDEVQALIDRFKGLIEDSGAQVTLVDIWGKRKLAYPIQKFNEGKYVFLFVVATEAPPWSDVERLMQQDERILRHLVVRTDLDLKRAMRKGKVKPEDVPNAELFAVEEPAAAAAVAEAEGEATNGS